jgi:hypothetical protein
MVTLGFGASSQQITYAEYYLDAPVQNGLGISIPLTQNGDSISPSFTIPSTGLSSGLHHISIRVRNSLGVWSIIENRQFIIQEASYPVLKNAPLKSFEYYFDADINGTGNYTKFSFPNFSDSVESSFTFSTVGLNKGLHTIYYRFQDSLGKWSLFEGRNFIIQEDSYPTEKTARLNSFEYYIDNDATGQGSYQRFSLNGNLDSVESAFNLSSAGISAGNHTLYIRFLDSLGRWSLFEGRNFEIKNYPAAKVSSGIVEAEYYKDLDPGPGNGNQILKRIMPVDSLSENHIISTLNLTAGIDSIFVRVKDSTGVWSLPKYVRYEICANSPAKPVLAGDSISYACKGIKFSKNVIPTVGTNTYWRGPNSFVYVGDTLQIIQLNETHFGRYYIYKVKGSTGCDTSEVKIFDLLESAPIDPLKLGVISQQSICAGDTIKLISPVTGNFKYLWYKNQSIISSDTNTNPELRVYNSGKYGLQIKTTIGCLYAMKDSSISFNPRPIVPIILGKSVGVVNGKDVFTSSLISLQHNWFAWNGNIVSRNDSNSVAIQWPNLAVNASIKLVHKNNFGCQSDTGYKQVGIQLPYFNSDSVFLINSNTNKLNIPFQTNYKWKVSSNQTWLQVTKDSVGIADNFQIDVDANNLSIERSGLIRVENEFLFKLIRITQSPSSGIVGIQNNSEINVFPNPNSGYLYISNIPKSITKISFTDIAGRVLLKDLIPNFGELQLDIHEFPDASYCLVLEDSNGLKQVVKIIKTKN